MMKEGAMFQMTIDQTGAAPVEASANGDVLFDLGLMFSTGREGIIDLIAAHKWFNLAALKGRADAIQLRRELAEQMSAEDIALAQREARAWMTAH
jgi:TPR repeat protein